MAYVLSKIEEMGETFTERLIREQLFPEEQSKLEQTLDCLITQKKSSIEGLVSDIEKEDKFRIVAGTGIVLDNVSRSKTKKPYLGILYEIKLLMEQKIKFMDAVEAFGSYASKKAVIEYPIAFQVPARIIEEMIAAKTLGVKTDWKGLNRAYEFPNNLTLLNSITDNEFGIQVYFPNEKRKCGIETLIEAATEFEKNIGLKLP